MKTKTLIPRFWPASAPRRLVLAAALLAAVLLVAGACSSGGGSGSGSSILFTADDGLVLHGRVYGSGAPVVVLAHMLNSDQKAWERFAGSLASRGFMAVTFDFRGHGESPGDKEVGIADADLSAALRFVRDILSRPRVFLVGASMGGTAALKVASHEEVLGVVALSAPVSIRGLSAAPDVEGVTAPKLFIAAEGDGAALRNARRIFDMAPEPKALEVLPGDRHGTNLLKGSDADQVRGLIFGFLDRNR